MANEPFERCFNCGCKHVQFHDGTSSTSCGCMNCGRDTGETDSHEEARRLWREMNRPRDLATSGEEIAECIWDGIRKIAMEEWMAKTRTARECEEIIEAMTRRLVFALVPPNSSLGSQDKRAAVPCKGQDERLRRPCTPRLAAFEPSPQGPIGGLEQERKTR